jgi:acetamidase/formamidase
MATGRRDGTVNGAERERVAEGGDVLEASEEDATALAVGMTVIEAREGFTEALGEAGQILEVEFG